MMIKYLCAKSNKPRDRHKVTQAESWKNHSLRFQVDELVHNSISWLLSMERTADTHPY